MNDQVYDTISAAQGCLIRVETLKEKAEKAGLLEKAKIAEEAISASVEMNEHIINALVLMVEAVEELNHEQ